METTNTVTRGPSEGAHAYGVDEPRENRPGVPMEAKPEPAEGAHWDTPPHQQSDVVHLHRKGLDQLTPVYGTAQPPHGFSGAMRRIAYKIPEHSPMHWMMLLSADRVDILEDRFTNGLGTTGADAIRRQIKTNPLPALLIAWGAGAALRKVLR